MSNKQSQTSGNKGVSEWHLLVTIWRMRGSWYDLCEKEDDTIRKV